MYLRTIKRKNKDGSIVEYVQLANNVWNKEKGFAQAQVIHSFGRSDQLDVDALKRLIKSVSRLLGPEDAIRLERQNDDLKFISSRPAGGAYLLKAVTAGQKWTHLGPNSGPTAVAAGNHITL
jgi:hypothetical protein